ncbi:MAG TPA: adenylosuccinate synthase [Longimicrobiales bacterium]|nr:adenylosuccinate synthase [Longimicrobiales bacterium]
MKAYRCLVVVGAQWGDEGKGKIVDVLAAEAGVIARYQGGANAGHTVHIGDGSGGGSVEEFILHQIPSGILHAQKRCLLGNGVVLDLEQFFEELDALEARGIDAEPRIGISGRAHLLLEYHKRLDQANERARGAGKIGTTGRGIGPAYEDKVARMGVRVADLRDAEHARELIVRAAQRANDKLAAVGAEQLDVNAVAETVLARRERLLPLVTDTGAEITAALRDDRRVLLEGAQGAMLDVDHGTYPYVTSSTTTAAGAATGSGIGPTVIDHVLGVVKAYTTRVGSGPLPTEIPPPLGDQLRELGGEYGATTGRPRRCGWFDAVVVRYAAQVNGLTGLAITKLDVLDTFDTIRICTGYTIDGTEHSSFPYDLTLLGRATPVYETMAGWQQSTAAARSYDELPAKARAYLERIQELTGVEITYVSVGTKREQIISV